MPVLVTKSPTVNRLSSKLNIAVSYKYIFVGCETNSLRNRLAFMPPFLNLTVGAYIVTNWCVHVSRYRFSLISVSTGIEALGSGKGVRDFFGAK